MGAHAEYYTKEYQGIKQCEGKCTNTHESANNVEETTDGDIAKFFEELQHDELVQQEQIQWMLGVGSNALSQTMNRLKGNGTYQNPQWNHKGSHEHVQTKL